VGYDLHITRAADWSEGEAHPIGLAEWRAVVAGDSELDLTGAAEAVTPEGTLRYENEGLAIWTAHPSGEPVWFDCRRGSVIVKNPDEPTISKMIAISRLLDAKVQGDDGETYPLPAGRPLVETVPPPRTSLLQRVSGWFAGGGVRPARQEASEPVPTVGDRVRDFRGRQGTVLEVDSRVNQGLGRIRVRFDDGSELALACAAHGLTILGKGDGAA